MNTDAFIETIREEIREEGYSGSTYLLLRIRRLIKEFKVEGLDPNDESSRKVISLLPCNDVKRLDIKKKIGNKIKEDFIMVHL